MTPCEYCYLNYCQSDKPELEPVGFLLVVPGVVASSLNLYRVCKIIVCAVAGYPEFGIQVVVTAYNRVTLFYVNIYAWHSSAFYGILSLGLQCSHQ